MPVVTLAIAPSGQVIFLPDGGDGPALPDEVAARIAEAFHEGAAAGLLHLAAAELATPLPPAFVFWRDFSRRCLTRLCRIAGAESEEGLPDDDAPPPSPEELLRRVEASPPLRGLEYLSPAVLENLWTALEGHTREEAKRAGGNVQDYLKKRNPLWNMVGRVAFHLAENRKNEARPFGFLVTYTTRLSGLAKPQYLPLGKAFREFADAGDRRGLLALLTPLKRAAEASALIRELVESGEIFHPLAWTLRETRRFLDDVPHFESAGVLVRIPGAWQGRGRPPRPQVSVTVGTKKPGGLGIDALLDFSVGLTLDGEELTEEERRAKAQKQAEKLRKKGETLTPVVIAGRTIAATFWGKAWCQNLERYGDYENRIPRGRAYVRNGSVVDLKIGTARVDALVSGSRLYSVEIEIRPLKAEVWKGVKGACTGRIGSLLELLQGKLSREVMEIVTRPRTGLFPEPAEISFRCSCPDWASMCKHVAAVLYGVGARLDREPELLFSLRGVDHRELIAAPGAADLAASPGMRDKMIAEEDLAGIFGIEIDERPAARQPAQETPKRDKGAETPEDGWKIILYRLLRVIARPSAPEHGRASTLPPPTPPGSVPVPAASRPEIDSPRNPAGRGARPGGPPRRSSRGRSRPSTSHRGRRSLSPALQVSHEARRGANGPVRPLRRAAFPVWEPAAGSEYSGD